MKSPYDFIVQPSGDRYNNTKKVEGGELILNTEVFNHQYVNREAVIKSVPVLAKTDLKVGDVIIVHHNVFRRWHNMRGEEKNSRSYYNDETYFIKQDQIFLYKRDSKWEAPEGYCFVKPIKAIDKFNTDSERPLIGILKYGDNNLAESGIRPGDLVGFTPSSEYEFVVDGERMYRVYASEISIKYEYQGNEEEYNPSWA